MKNARTIIKKIRVTAVALGVVVDLAGSFIMGIVTGISIAIMDAVQRGPHIVSQQDAHKMVLSHLQDTNVLSWSMSVGFLFTLLAGYLTGRVAKQAEVLNSFCVGAFIVIISIMFPDEQVPLWALVVAAVGTIPVVMLGGYLAKGYNQSKLKVS